MIATSSAAGAVYLSRGLTHTRLAMTMEIATTLGALAGGITAVLISPNILSGIFAAVLFYVAYTMSRGQEVEGDPTQVTDDLNSTTDPVRREYPSLNANYQDPKSGNEVSYSIYRLPLGLGASFLAGNISGLLELAAG